MTSQQLRGALGYTGIGASNLAYGSLGKMMAERLSFSVSDRPENRPGWWSFQLATVQENISHGLCDLSLRLHLNNRELLMPEMTVLSMLLM